MKSLTVTTTLFIAMSLSGVAAHATTLPPGFNMPGPLQTLADKLKIAGLWEGDAIEFAGQPLPPGIARSWQHYDVNGNLWAVVPFPGFDNLDFIGQWEYLGRDAAGNIAMQETYKVDFSDPNNILGNPECVVGTCDAYSVAVCIINSELVAACNVGGLRYTSDSQTFLGFEPPSKNVYRKINAKEEVDARFSEIGVPLPSVPDPSEIPSF